MNHPTPLPGIKLFDLTGRTAVISGGSKCLYLAMAAGLASAGADLMLATRARFPWPMRRAFTKTVLSIPA